MGLEWSRVPRTLNWQLIDAETEQIIRHVVVRGDHASEAGDAKFEVTGDAHEHSTHDTLQEAGSAAEASLSLWEQVISQPPWEQD